HLYSRPGREVEDSAVLLLELEGDRVISLEVTWALLAERERQYLQVIGTGGSGSLPPIRVFKDTESGLLDLSPQLTQSRENQFTASYRQELAHFVEAVRNQGAIETPAEHATLMRIVDAAYRSAEERAEVRIRS